MERWRFNSRKHNLSLFSNKRENCKLSQSFEIRSGKRKRNRDYSLDSNGLEKHRYFREGLIKEIKNESKKRVASHYDMGMESGVLGIVRRRIKDKKGVSRY